ncbi:MAG: amidohydrolase family protein [Planctomycetota bacterium]
MNRREIQNGWKSCGSSSLFVKALSRLGLLCLGFILLFPVALAKEEALIAFKASHVLDGKGRCLENGVVVLEGSRIVSVESGVSLPADLEVLDFGKAYICPGFIDLFTALGAQGDQADLAFSTQPGLRAEEVFHPFHEQFEEALACGITTVMIVPSADNVIAGCGALVKTWGESRSHRILREQGPLVMTVGSSCFKQGRYPTSRIGAMDLLVQSLENAEPGTPVEAFSKGRLDGYFFAQESVDILAAQGLARDLSVRLTVVGGAQADEVMDGLESNNLSFLFGPFDFTTSERVLLIPAAASEAEFAFAFTARSPDRKSSMLRVTAALAAQAGLDREKALAALTGQAALLGQVSSRIGALAPGLDGDLLVFTEHPMNLHARLLRVYVNGELAYKAAQIPTDLAGVNR